MTKTENTVREKIDEIVTEYGDRVDFQGMASGFDECVDKLLELVEEEKKRGYDDGVYACRIEEEKCPRHLSSLRCIDCIQELFSTKK